MTPEIQQIIGYVAATISFLAYIPYIIEFVGGRTKTHPLTYWIWKYGNLSGGTNPRQASWLVWAALQYVIFSSSREQGATDSAWIAFGYLIGSSLTAILLFWYGDKKWGKLDVFCGALAVASLILLYGTRNSFWALMLAIATDAIAAIPTIVSVTKEPKNESKLGWSVFLVGVLVNLGAIKELNFQEAGFSFYLLLVIGYINLRVWLVFGKKN